MVRDDAGRARTLERSGRRAARALGARRRRLDFSRLGEDDSPMNERPPAGSGVVGYAIVLVRSGDCRRTYGGDCGRSSKRRCSVRRFAV